MIADGGGTMHTDHLACRHFRQDGARAQSPTWWPIGQVARVPQRLDIHDLVLLVYPQRRSLLNG